MKQQIVISGVGGQGVLFVTRILAEAAISKGLPVFTSETHGMAQRGGTVISHLKVGDFTSPLIRPALADGLLALKEETADVHRYFVKPDGWIVTNSSREQEGVHAVAADRIAIGLNRPKTVNLVLLGFALGRLGEKEETPFFFDRNNIEAVLSGMPAARANPEIMTGNREALWAGYQQGKGTN